ncbi:MAG: SRPBCC domain-containing protein [Sporichthyaceae bacterium]
MTELATILRDGERIGLRFRRSFPYPPERVWQSLHLEADLQNWFPCNLVGERAAGAALTMPFWPEVVEEYGLGDEPALEGEILAWEPHSLFEYRWDTEILRWELAATSDGTEVVLTTWLGQSEDAPPPEFVATGYHVCLDALQRLLDSRIAQSPSDAFQEALRVRYRLAVAQTA